MCVEDISELHKIVMIKKEKKNLQDVIVQTKNKKNITI